MRTRTLSPKERTPGEIPTGQKEAGIHLSHEA
jgi:hypothetical protein